MLSLRDRRPFSPLARARGQRGPRAATLTRGTVLLAGAVAVALKNSSVCGLTTVECVITPPAMTKEVLLNLCAAPLALPGCPLALPAPSSLKI